MALNGKTAVVTGAAMEIGQAMAEELLQNGAKVRVCECGRSPAESRAGQPSILAHIGIILLVF